MKKRRMIFALTVLVLALMLITAGCRTKTPTDPTQSGTQPIETQTQDPAEALRSSLADPAVTSVEVTETITVSSALEIAGTKTITGGGCIQADASFDEVAGAYMLVLSDGAEVTLENIRIDGQNIVGGVHVTENASLTLCADASVYYAVNTAANVLVEGECVIDGASLLTAGGSNLINRGTTHITDGLISGSGITPGYAGVYNEGTLVMDGGSVEASRTNVVVAENASFTFNAGTILDSIAEGICIEKGGSLAMNSSRAIVKGSGICGLYIEGTLEMTDGIVMTSTESEIQITADGSAVIHNGTITRGFGVGIYNAGSLTIENIEVSHVTEDAVINRGTLVMTGGSIHDNDGEGIVNRMGGTTTIVSETVSIYANHTGVVNEADSSLELAYAQVYDNTAYSVHNAGQLSMHNITVANSGSTSVYAAAGKLTMDNVVVDGTGANHGVYVVSGASVTAKKVTVKNTAGRGICNVGGTFTGSNITILRAGTDGIANATAAATTWIGGLYIGGSGNHNLQNASSGSVMNISNAVLGETTAHNVRNGKGSMTLTNVTIEGVKMKNGSSDSVHAIYSTASRLTLNNCTIQNVENGRAVFNRGTKTTIKGLTCVNINGYAVANALGSSDWPGDGTVDIDGLVIQKPGASAILQETPGGTVTIRNSSLTAAGSNNIIVNNRGTMIIEDGVDMTCSGRAINNKGTMVINGGTIHDITPTTSVMASAIYNVGDLTINDIDVYNNTATLKGVIGNVTVEYDYDQDGTNELLCGRLTINGGNFHNNQVAGGSALHGGAVYVGKQTTAALLGGNFWQNDAELGNDIYNAGTLTIGNVLVGRTPEGKACLVDGMAGEIYTTNELIFSGTAFPYTEQTPLHITLENPEVGKALIQVEKAMAETLKAGITVTDLNPEYYLIWEDGSLKVMGENVSYVCRIGETSYYSLGQAIEAVGDGEKAVIEILDDIALTETINLGDGTVTKHITLIDDGTARTISRGSVTGRMFRVYSGSSLTLKASAGLTLDGGAAGGKDAQIVYNQGTMNIHSGVVLCNNSTTAGGGAVNVAAGVVNVYGGKITGNETTGSHGGAFYVNTNGTLNISGGTISDNRIASGKYGTDIYSKGTVTITGGTVGAVSIDSEKTVTLSGGAYVGSIQLRSKSTITLAGNLTATKPMSIACADESSGRVVLTAGSYNAANLSKFTLNEDSSFQLKLDDTGAAVLYIAQNLAYIQETGISYATLAEAVAAVADGGSATIQIRGDIAMTQTINLGDGTVTKHITLIDDGTARTISRGSTLTGRFFRVYSGSSLTLKASAGLTLDGGSSSGKDNQFAYVQGTLNIHAGVVLCGNINSSGGGAVNVPKGGVVNMYGGTVTNNETTGSHGGAFYVNSGGVLNISGGTVSRNRIASGKYGTDIYSKGTLTVSGGIVGEADIDSGNTLTLSGNAYVSGIQLRAASTVTLAGDLTAAEQMCLAAADESSGRVMLEASKYNAANLAKFTLNSESGFQLKLDDNGAAVLYLDTNPVYIQETGTSYATLAEAVDAVADGGSATIEIRGDIAMTQTINLGDGTVTKHITLIDDGTARTISRGSALTGRFFRVYSGSSLTLQASAGLTLDGGSSSGKDNQFAYVQGTLNIHTGVVLCGNINSTGGGAVNVPNGGVVNMYGGTVTNNETTGNNGGAFYVNSGGVLNISGGTVSGNRIASGKYGTDIYSKGTVTITGGTVGDVCIDSGKTVTLSGGAYAGSIQLRSKSTITLASDLTAAEPMRISCDDESEGRIVLVESSYNAANLDKFALISDSAYQLKLDDTGAVLLAVSE
ncbi:MAG: right-handed parallel beta-helix repeat-containing protein [Oscillospiraceae bacterium]|nr:right-handed parallel beta-helix repeat-containing protein [Oscillospiraceae bacterium]